MNTATTGTMTSTTTTSNAAAKRAWIDGYQDGYQLLPCISSNLWYTVGYRDGLNDWQVILSTQELNCEVDDHA